MFRLADREQPVMKDRRGQHGVGVTKLHPVYQMVETPDAAGGDHRHRYGVRDGACQIEIEARLGTVAIHRGEQNLSSTETDYLPCIGNGVEPSLVASAMSENLPSRRLV